MSKFQVTVTGETLAEVKDNALALAAEIDGSEPEETPAPKAAKGKGKPAPAAAKGKKKPAPADDEDDDADSDEDDSDDSDDDEDEAGDDDDSDDDADSDDDDEDEAAVTHEAVLAQSKKYIKKHGRDKALKVLGKFGVAKVSDAKKDKLAAMLKAFSA